MQEADRHAFEELREQADADLVRRTLRGFWVYTAFIILLALEPSYRAHNPAILAGAGLVTLVLAACRYAVVRLKPRWYEHRRELWRTLFAACIVLTGAFWGLFVTFNLWRYGSAGRATLVLLICTAGTCAGAVVAMAPSFGLLASYLIALLAPMMGADLVRGEGFGLPLAVALFLFAMLLQGRNLNREYWSSLEDKQLLRRRAEELEIANERARAASRAKSEFLANMSHELRTPMHGILGLTSLALESPLNSDVRDCLETVHSSAGSLLRLIDEILEYSKMEAGKLRIEEAVFSLSELVDGVLKLFRPDTRRKSLNLACTVGETVPNLLWSDVGRLRQILTNLVGKAIKFTDHGEVRLLIEPVSQDAGHVQLRFTVADTGIGIAAGEQQRIFEAFTQVDSSKSRQHDGMGLGLAISARLVEILGGRLSVESEPGKGSKFHFALPFQIARTDHPETTTRRPSTL